MPSKPNDSFKDYDNPWELEKMTWGETVKSCSAPRFEARKPRASVKTGSPSTLPTLPEWAVVDVLDDLYIPHKLVYPGTSYLCLISYFKSFSYLNVRHSVVVEV